MHLPTALKYLLIAWVLPLVMVGIGIVATPDASRPREEFAFASFHPARVWIAESKDRKGADSFELRIQSPEGTEYFIRQPERGPIEALYRKVPRDEIVGIRYASKVNGNVLVEILGASGVPGEEILSFDTAMAEYATRRRVIFIVAAVWWGLANLIAFALWKAVPAVHERQGLDT